MQANASKCKQSTWKHLKTIQNCKKSMSRPAHATLINRQFECLLTKRKRLFEDSVDNTVQRPVVKQICENNNITSKYK